LEKNFLLNPENGLCITPYHRPNSVKHKKSKSHSHKHRNTSSREHSSSSVMTANGSQSSIGGSAMSIMSASSVNGSENDMGEDIELAELAL
jgi:hypothetical protein